MISLLTRSPESNFLTEFRYFSSISFPKYHLNFQSFGANINTKRVYFFHFLKFSNYNNRSNLDQRKKSYSYVTFKSCLSQKIGVNTQIIFQIEIFFQIDIERYLQLINIRIFNFHEFFLDNVKILIKKFSIYYIFPSSPDSGVLRRLKTKKTKNVFSGVAGLTRPYQSIKKQILN